MSNDMPEIDPKILSQWQDITNLMARLCDVPVSLIMRQNDDSMEVIVGSETEDSPYTPGEKAPLNGDLYCEEVVRSQQLLSVPNATKDPKWDHNPDLELGMLSYTGVPVNWPDGDPFGTLCILDRVEKQSSSAEQALLYQFAGIVEMSLELLLANRQLESLSLQDALTGIANRRLFDVVMARDWAQSLREKRPLSLLMCDIDFFKNYNDSKGHVQGDHCLRQVARALASVARRQLDLCARYGGEEFALLLPNTEADMAMQLAEACRRKVQEAGIPHPSSSIADAVTISIGVATTTASGKTSPVTLIELADQALYRAKRAGRNRVKQSEAVGELHRVTTAAPA